MFLAIYYVQCPESLSTCPHLAVQLRGKLGLKLAGGPFTVVSLDEDLVGQRCTVPQLLQVVELMDGNVIYVETNTIGFNII